MNPIRTPAWKTSEFWVTAATMLINLFVGSGAFTSSDGDQLTNSLGQIVAAFVNVLAVFGYVRSRSALKEKQAELIATNPQLCTSCGKKLEIEEKVAIAERKLEVAEEKKAAKDKIEQVEKKIEEVENKS